jgi:uncharacterized protein (DUF934 family)
MPLVKSGRIVPDRYVRIPDGAPIPDNGAIIVTASRLLAERDHFARRIAPIGVVWPNDRPVAELAHALGCLDLIVLSFPSFRDGRAYSQARILRERYDFRGELRATGQVLRDQFLFLLRAGFSAFEVIKDSDAAAFADSVRRFDVFYQPTGDGRPTVLRTRLGRLMGNSARVANDALTLCDTGGRKAS